MLVPTQTLLVDAIILMVGVRFGFTAIVMPLLVEVAVAKQVALLVSTQVIISPLFKVAETNVELLVPAFVPFTFHW